MFLDDCQNNNSLKEECNQLLDSETDFRLYAFQSLRLAISGSLSSPLYLTVHRGVCNHSCEGGSLQACHTDKQYFTWQNVSSPFVLENSNFLQSNFFYCITAKISDKHCCPVCTNTEFMKGVSEPDSSSVFSDSLWNLVILLSVVVVLLGVLILLTRFHKKGRKSGSPDEECESFDHIPLHDCKHKDAQISKRITQTKVVCLYIEEESKLFLETINSLQSSLRQRGLNVIDIYAEEENIFKSIIRWAQNVLESPEIKILLVDTRAMRQLWRRDLENSEACRATERAILYIRECVKSHSLYNKWFVVSFQRDDVIVPEDMIHLTNGRRYIYPDHVDRLAEHIMKAQ